MKAFEEALIRPPRAELRPEMLGPERIGAADDPLVREDLVLSNARLENIKCTFYRCGVVVFARSADHDQAIEAAPPVHSVRPPQRWKPY
jgi:hypothetical protein